MNESPDSDWICKRKIKEERSYRLLDVYMFRATLCWKILPLLQSVFATAASDVSDPPRPSADLNAGKISCLKKPPAVFRMNCGLNSAV